MPLIKSATNRVMRDLKRCGKLPDEDSIMSDIQYSLVLCVSHWNPEAELSRLVNEALRFAGTRAFTKYMGTRKRSKSTVQWKRDLSDYEENSEDDLSYEDYTDTISDTGVPYAEDLRRWLDHDQNATQAFPNRNDRKKWREVKLPEIREHLRRIYEL